MVLRSKVDIHFSHHSYSPHVSDSPLGFNGASKQSGCTFQLPFIPAPFCFSDSMVLHSEVGILFSPHSLSHHSTPQGDHFGRVVNGDTSITELGLRFDLSIDGYRVGIGSASILRSGDNDGTMKVGAMRCRRDNFPKRQTLRQLEQSQFRAEL